MPFGNSSFLVLQKLAEINTAITNANDKVSQLDNFDYQTMTMGNYRLKDNIEQNTLDIEYIPTT